MENYRKLTNPPTVSGPFDRLSKGKIKHVPKQDHPSALSSIKREDRTVPRISRVGLAGGGVPD